jgi:hypothetical protein
VALAEGWNGDRLARLGHAPPNMAMEYEGLTEERLREIADRLAALAEGESIFVGEPSDAPDGDQLAGDVVHHSIPPDAQPPAVGRHVRERSGRTGIIDEPSDGIECCPQTLRVIENPAA